MYFVFIVNLNSHMWAVATILDSAGAENGLIGDRQKWILGYR